MTFQDNAQQNLTPAEKLRQLHQSSYPDMDFDEFTKRVHQKQYSDMPYEEFTKKIGLEQKPESWMDRLKSRLKKEFTQMPDQQGMDEYDRIASTMPLADKEAVESVGNIGGALIGGLAAFPAAGVAGIAAGAKEIVTGKPERAMASAGHAVETVGSLPMRLLKNEAEEKAVETLMKPMEWVEYAGKTYGDWYFDKFGDPEGAAALKSAFEAIAFVGLPEMKVKLFKSIRMGKAEAIKQAAIETRMAALEKLKAEPNRLSELARAEKLIRETGKYTPPVDAGKFPVKSARESAAAFEDPANLQAQQAKLRQQIEERIRKGGYGQYAPEQKAGAFPVKSAKESATAFDDIANLKAENEMLRQQIAQRDKGGEYAQQIKQYDYAHGQGKERPVKPARESAEVLDSPDALQRELDGLKQQIRERSERGDYSRQLNDYEIKLQEQLAARTGRQPKYGMIEGNRQKPETGFDNALPLGEELPKPKPKTNLPENVPTSIGGEIRRFTDGKGISRKGVKARNGEAVFGDLPQEANYLIKNEGVSLDLVEEHLVREGYLQPGQDLIEILRQDKNALGYGKIGAEERYKNQRLRPEEKRMQEEPEYPPEWDEGPPAEADALAARTEKLRPEEPAPENLAVRTEEKAKTEEFRPEEPDPADLEPFDTAEMESRFEEVMRFFEEKAQEPVTATMPKAEEVQANWQERLKARIEEQKAMPEPEKNWQEKLRERIAEEKAVQEPVTKSHGLESEKAPWEMTQKEVLEAIRDRSKLPDEKTSGNLYAEGLRTLDNGMSVHGIPVREIRGWDKALAAHRETVEKAVSEGRHIPDEVLKEYPEIAEKAKIRESVSKSEENFAKFVEEKSENHQVWYNGKQVDMGYIPAKKQFSMAGMRIADNGADFGFIKTPKGEFYKVSKGNKTAKYTPESEVREYLSETRKPAEPVAERHGLESAEKEITEQAMPKPALKAESTGKDTLPVEDLPSNIFALRKIAKERGIDLSDIKGAGALQRVKERISGTETGKKASVKAPHEMTLKEYAKEHFHPRSKNHSEVNEIWGTWQKQKMMGQRTSVPEKSFKELLSKTEREYHDFEIIQAAKRGEAISPDIVSTGRTAAQASKLMEEIREITAEAERRKDKVEITENKSGDKEISVDIPAKEEKKLTPAEQKKYLLDEIDIAIENAPDLGKYENRISKDSMERVTIHVPNDGEFSILNTKASLTDFRKKVNSKFPAKKESRPVSKSQDQIGYGARTTEYKKTAGKDPEKLTPADIESIAERLNVEKQPDFYNWLLEHGLKEDTVKAIREQVRRIPERDTDAKVKRAEWEMEQERLSKMAPWEKTSSQAYSDYNEAYKHVINTMARKRLISSYEWHRNQIKDAMKRGRKIPDHVLDEYPDLKEMAAMPDNVNALREMAEKKGVDVSDIKSTNVIERIKRRIWKATRSSGEILKNESGALNIDLRSSREKFRDTIASDKDMVKVHDMIGKESKGMDIAGHWADLNSKYLDRFDALSRKPGEYFYETDQWGLPKAEAHKAALRFASYKDVAQYKMDALKSGIAKSVRQEPDIFTDYLAAHRALTRAKVKRLYDPEIKALNADLKAAGHKEISIEHGATVKEVNDLLAKRKVQGISADAYAVETRNPNKVTGADAKAAIKKYEKLWTDSGYELKDLKDSFKAFQDWTHKHILTEMADAGLISKARAREIKSNNEFYATFDVLEHMPADLNNLPALPSKEYFSVKNINELKKIKGTEKQIAEPVQATVDKFFRVQEVMARNKVASALIDDPNMAASLRRVAENEKEFGILKNQGQNPILRGAWNEKEFGTVSRFKNGEAETFLAPIEIAEAMKQLSPEHAPRAVMAVNNVFRKAATSVDIAFILNNIRRDFVTGFVSSPMYKPTDLPKYAKQILKGLKEGVKDEFGKGSAVVREMTEAGAGFGFVQEARTAKEAKQTVFREKSLKNMGIDVVTSPVKLLNIVEKFSGAVEKAPRIAVYEQAKSKGMRLEDAALMSRRSTVDFNMAGTYMRTANQWIPFLNARMQGKANLVRALRTDTLNTIAKIGTLIMIPGMVTYAWNRLFHSDLLDDVPEWIRKDYFVMITGKDKDKKGNDAPEYFLIPKGDIGTAAWNPVEYAFDRAMKKDREGMTHFLINTLSDLSPVDFAREGELSLSKTAASVLPPPVKAGAELLSNKDLYRGRDIEPRYMQENRRPEDRYFEDTPAVYKAAGEKLGISPLKIQAVMGNILAGYGRTGGSPTAIVEKIGSRLRRVQGGEQERKAWDAISELEEEYRYTRTDALNAAEEGDREKALQIMREWNAESGKRIEQYNKQFSKYGLADKGGLRKKTFFTFEKMRNVVRGKADDETSAIDKKLRAK